MPNSYFSFKQFTIQQDQTAMKVCTDACIFGAYVQVGQARHILDIGTGTGLLALMLAQRAENATIDAVEIDVSAHKQALENVQASPFKDRICVHHLAIQDFLPAKQYDLIITNPPFYTHYLQSGKPLQDNAWHTNTLPTTALLQAITSLLLPTGKVWILLPAYEMNLFTQEAQNLGLYPQETLAIYTLPTKPIWREIKAFGFTENKAVLETICVGDNAFKDLMKTYYLNL